jgi:transposase
VSTLAKGQKKYTDEFKNTIIELYNSGKSLSELSSEYGISKSPITGWSKKSKLITEDKYTTITSTDYQEMIKKMTRLEEENEILKKPRLYSQRSKFSISIYLRQ